MSPVLDFTKFEVLCLSFLGFLVCAFVRLFPGGLLPELAASPHFLFPMLLPLSVPIIAATGWPFDLTSLLLLLLLAAAEAKGQQRMAIN